MLRVTDDVLELRTWAEERGGRPCRLADGRLTLCFGPDDGSALTVGWDEFEVVFVGRHRAVAYGEAPGGHTCFLGSEDEVHDYVRRSDPRITGEGPMHPRTG